MGQATKEKTEIRRLSLDDWLAEGKARFGDDPRMWPFVCPNCKHVQTMNDFAELKRLGIFDGDIQDAYFYCIGRIDTRIPEKDIGRIDGVDKSPCDYTLGGLFRFAKTIVIDGDGEEHLVFEFGSIEHEGAGDSPGGLSGRLPGNRNQKERPGLRGLRLASVSVSGGCGY